MDKKLNDFLGLSQSDEEIKYLGSIEDWNKQDAEAGDMVLLCLNERIKRLRLKNGLTQCELAKVLNITQRDYWRIEKTGYKVSPMRLFHIAFFYNVSLDYIFGLIKEEKNIYDSPTCLNGYVLEEMKKAKSEGREYIPMESQIYDKRNEEDMAELRAEIQAEMDEIDAEFLEAKKKAGLED